MQVPRPRCPPLFAAVLLVGASLGFLQSCAEAEAVSLNSGRIDQVRLGFALDPDGRVGTGCTASSFALHDPIHLSMMISDAVAGAVLRVSVRDVVTQRVAWSEERSLAGGQSYQTFAIGPGLATGRFRADSTLNDTKTIPRNFQVHERLRSIP